MFGQGSPVLPRAGSAPCRASGCLTADHAAARCPFQKPSACAIALFTTWARSDVNPSFRWDPREDVRYAHRAHRSPPTPKRSSGPSTGANRLAAVGLALLTVVPATRGQESPGWRCSRGDRGADGSFSFSWPIWRDQISLAAIRALLGHPGLDDPATRAALGVVDRRRTLRISTGKFMNFTPG